MKKAVVILEMLCILVTASGIHQVTEGNPSDDFPSFSPDGTRIAFQRSFNLISSGQKDIYMKEINSTGVAVKITTNNANDEQPVWLVNTNSISFYSDRVPNGIWTHNLNTGNEVMLIEDAGSHAWSPDGNSIVYAKNSNDSGGTDLYKKNIQTGIEIRLTSDPGQDAYPDWSPDGQYIIYNHSDYNPGIYIIPANGGTPTQVPGIWGWGPKYSPDGTKICFDAGSFTSGVFIYIYDLTTGQLANTHVPGMNPDWSPIGDKIAYMCSGDIYYMDYPFVQEPSSLGRIRAMYK